MIDERKRFSPMKTKFHVENTLKVSKKWKTRIYRERVLKNIKKWKIGVLQNCSSDTTLKSNKKESKVKANSLEHKRNTIRVELERFFL